ncbi:MAG: T9SS type A sorting domain-containing protein [Bacteroidia bacterium]
MKKTLLYSFLLAAATSLSAQTAATIQQIQYVSPADLANCIDSSSYKGQVVTTRGVVVMPFGLAVNGTGATQLRNVWIQDGTGAFSGLDIFDSNSADIDNLVAGDSIEITGTVTEFGPTGGPQVESELISITAINLLGTNRPVKSQLIDLGDLNNATQINQLETGEQWEGAFVELYNVTVTAVVPFAGNTRVSFNVVDANGNMINVSDRFKVQKLPAAGGTFVPPAVGTVYDTLKGVIMHSPNGCTNFNGRGYELHPFDASHYVVGNVAPPQISAIVATPMVPTSSQTVTVSANIVDQNVGGTIASATLYYAVGPNNTTYSSATMTASGNTWSGTIPAQSDGSFVKYYVCATDNDNLSSCSPNVPAGSVNNPLAYVVRDNGLTIYDVQFTPFTSGNSIYLDKTVTLTGIVTASAEPGNLGYVFIQQENVLNWGGIMVQGNAALASLLVGDKVTVTGDMKESFGFTRMENVTSVSKIGTGSITPLNLDPSIFSLYGFATNEQYEGMLVKLKNGTNKLYVADENADDPGLFGEYRVGIDQFQPDNGCRILAGRTSTGVVNSLNVSYIAQQNATWTGINVDTTYVILGDCMNSVTGVMYYSFSNMKMLPRNNADFEMYNIGCVSSIDEATIAAIKVKTFPTPANENLTVRYDFPENMAATFTLFDLAGRQVAVQTISGKAGETSINTQNLSSGTYILTTSAENTVIARNKVMIAK